MNFKEEIKKAVICFGQNINIFYDGQRFCAHCLARQIVENEEEYFNSPSQQEIGACIQKKFNFWIALKEEIPTIDFIVFKNKQYKILNKKYNDETGCFEIVAIERN